MTFPDLFKDMIDSSRERIRNPFTGAFIISFVIYNWRPIFLLMFSDEMIENKIAVINSDYCTWDSIVVPIFIAAFYVVMIPYIMWFFDFCTTTGVNNRVKTKYDRKVHELTEYEKVLNKEKINEDVRSGNRDVKMLNDEVASLQKQIDDIDATHKSLTENYENIIKEKDILIDMLKKRSNDSDTNLKRTKKALDVLQVSPIFEAFNESELHNFVRYCQYYFSDDYTTSRSLDIDLTLEKKFIEHGLIKMEDEDRPQLTNRGKIIQEIFTD